MARLCFDYGHGGEDSGACYKGRKESSDVLSIGKEVAEEIRRHGVEVDEVRRGDTSVSLGERCAFENKNMYDYFISFHRNAYEPEKARGAETYIYLNPGEKATELAENIQASLVAFGFVNRGVKKADFHVLRATKAPAILVEIGFIDNTDDNNIFDYKRNEIIKVLAKAILSVLGVKYIEPSESTLKTSGKMLYRVMAGSYMHRENAENQVKKLIASGFDATIMIFNK